MSDSVSRRSLSFLPLLTALGVVVWAPSEADAQIPDEFTNLQVLPEDISKAELVSTMRGFAGALGVRCNFCHTVSNMLDDPDDDFAADDKSTKRKARLMIEMVERINEETLPTLPNRRSPSVDVTCRTCHGGLSRPVPIDRQIEWTISEEGIEAAVEQYTALRERYHGSRAYDFSFSPLNELAERLLGEDMPAQAVQVLELNAEYHPTSPPTLTLLGHAHEENGDPESAVRVYESILDLDPSIPFLDFYAGQARQRIEALGG